jgi:hypothetical protein
MEIMKDRLAAGFQIVACCALAALVLAGCERAVESERSVTESSSAVTTEVVEPSEVNPYLEHSSGYILRDYPEDVVPLYESVIIDEWQYATSGEAVWWGRPGGGLRNWYSVIFRTEATPEDVETYYRNLVDSVSEDTELGPCPLYESGGKCRIAGTVGKYRVQVGIGSGLLKPNADGSTSVYVEVDLPESELTIENPYFAGFPRGMVKVDPAYPLIAGGYSLNASAETVATYGGPKESYMQRYGSLSDADALRSYFREMYSDREGFSEESGMVRWKDNGYDIQVLPGWDGKFNVLVVEGT